MLRIEFPSASPADVTGPQALDLRADARALLGARRAHGTAHAVSVSRDTVANYTPIITLFDFFIFSKEGRPYTEFIYLRVY